MRWVINSEMAVDDFLYSLFSIWYLVRLRENLSYSPSTCELFFTVEGLTEMQAKTLSRSSRLALWRRV